MLQKVKKDEADAEMAKKLKKEVKAEVKEEPPEVIDLDAEDEKSPLKKSPVKEEPEGGTRRSSRRILKEVKHGVLINIFN